jgi:hypothetical protein
MPPGDEVVGASSIRLTGNQEKHYYSISSSSSAIAYKHSFIVINDIHVDPYYNASVYRRETGMCRDPARDDKCGGNGNDYVIKHSSKRMGFNDAPFRYGRHGCDPPSLLLDAALDAIAALYSHSVHSSSSSSSSSSSDAALDFVVFLGDAVPHFSACWQDTLATIKLFVGTVRTALVDLSVSLKLPGAVPVFPVLGNNDLYPAFYLSGQQISELCVLYHDVGWLSDADGHESYNGRSSKSEFCRGGFYSRLVVPVQRRAQGHGHKGGLRVVALNTVAWSVWLKAEPDGQSHAQGTLKGCKVGAGLRAEDPYAQFLWLNSTLAWARLR